MWEDRSMGATIRSARAVVGVASLILLGACGDKDVVNVIPRVATSLTVSTASQGQTGVAGAALATPISVRVLDQNGNAMSGVTVSWAAGTNSGSVASASSVSDANGDATVVWTLGNTAGANTLTASLANGATATINATGTAGVFATLSIVSGDAQSVTAGAVTQAMVVKAVDANGNVVAGVPIAWTTTGGGTLSAATGTTDANGLAQVTLTTSGTAGAYTVVGTSGTQTVTFNGSGM
jgi:adhesin/invasin